MGPHLPLAVNTTPLILTFKAPQRLDHSILQRPLYAGFYGILLLLVPQFLSPSAALCHILQAILKVLSHDAYSLSPATDTLASVLTAPALIPFTAPPPVSQHRRRGALNLANDMLRPWRPCVTLPQFLCYFICCLCLFVRQSRYVTHDPLASAS